MASMVSKHGCSSGGNAHATSSLSVQENGSRNKRKFRAELPLGFVNKTSPSAQNECSSYEFSADKFEVISSNGHPTGCDLCSVRQDDFDGLKLDLGLPSGEIPTDANPRLSREDFEIDEFQDADWNDFTEAELEELVLINLNAIFRSAIKKIVACGYTEEAATKAVSRSCICYGCNDTLSNIVDNGLTFLKSGQEIDYSREHFFEDLQLLEKYILAELVCVLREVRPFFSNGDAMWCLLICDMNVFHACSMVGDPFGSLGSDDGTSNVSLPPTQIKSETKSSDSFSMKNLPITCSHSHQSEAAGFSNNSKSKNSFVHNGEALNENGTNSTCDGVDINKPFSMMGTSSSVCEGKTGNSKKFQSNTAKREYMLRQKSLHLEKSYRTYGSRARKLSGVGGLIFDKKLKAVSGSAAINLKSGSLKISKGMRIDVAHDNGNDNLSTAAFSSSNVVSNSEAVDTNSGFPKNKIQLAIASPVSSAQPVLPAADISPLFQTADTELSLYLPTKANIVSSSSIVFDETSNINHAGKPFAKSLGRWVPHDPRDETIVKLIPRVRELQIQLQEWNEWANQKVMQAARRLGKDKAELKALRQEKEEVERLKKEKQTLAENTMKKLSEMENALCKASGQVKLANSAVRRLEIENVSLWQEMEGAKLRAAESAASCQETSKREKKTLMKFHSWEKQKAVFEEELIAEKHILTQLLLELEQAKKVQEQYEAKTKLEEQTRQQLIMQAASLTKEREQFEASVKAKQDTIRQKAENNLQNYKDNMGKLERQISELRRKSDSSRIAALKRGIDGSYAGIVCDPKPAPNQKDVRDLASSSSMKNLQLHSVKREHECVMCLTEERVVVFLPCAHQVVCATCNGLHEKQGMKDCPSCRGPIRQRISIRTARA